MKPDHVTDPDVKWTLTYADALTPASSALLHKAIIEHGFGSFDGGVQSKKTGQVSATFTFKTHKEVVDFCKRLKK